MKFVVILEKKSSNISCEEGRQVFVSPKTDDKSNRLVINLHVHLKLDMFIKTGFKKSHEFL